MSKILKYQFLILFVLAGFVAIAQSGNPESRLDEVEGFEKLELLVGLSQEYLDTSPGKTLRYSDDALDYAEELKGDELTYNETQEINFLEANAHYFAGLAYEQLENSKSAISSFRKALRIAKRTQYEEMKQMASAKLAEYGKGGGFEIKVAEGTKSILNNVKEWALKDTASKIKNSLKSIAVLSNESKAEKAIDERDYARAIELYEKNIPYHQANGDSENLKRTYLLIAGLYEKLNKAEEAENYRLLGEGKRNPEPISESKTSDLEVIEEIIEDLAEVLSEEALPEEKEASSVLNMAERLAKEGKYEESADYYKQFVQLQEKLKQEKANSLANRTKLDSQLIQLELFTNDMELQESKMAQIELKRQRNGLFATGLLVVAALLGILFYFNRRSHKKLSQAYLELAQTHGQLKDTQTQLVSAEKMASLGQLTAGIAHEINNPVNFISGNIDPLKNDVADLLEVLAAYEEAARSDQLHEKLKSVEQLKKELEIDYVTDEIQDLLKGIDEGANRTTEIVKGLRTFARLDEGARKHFNVQESLDSTLLLLQHKTSNIQIVRDYRSIPNIEGFPGKINQVFMNVLDNAIQAMPEGGTIYLTTKNLDDKVEISIKDTGTGIPEEVKARIFEPFFTTKDVGEGTGLGLSISHGIIEQHDGTIEIQSELDEGTEIVITLPI